MVKLLTDVKVF